MYVFVTLNIWKKSTKKDLVNPEKHQFFSSSNFISQFYFLMKSKNTLLLIKASSLFNVKTRIIFFFTLTVYLLNSYYHSEELFGVITHSITCVLQCAITNPVAMTKVSFLPPSSCCLPPPPNLCNRATRRSCL